MYVTLPIADLLGLMEATVAFLLAAMLLASGKVGVRWFAAFVFVFGISFAQASLPVAALPSWMQALVRWMYFTQLLALPFLFQYAMFAVGNTKKLAAYHYLPAGVAAIILFPAALPVVPASIGITMVVWGTVLQAVIYLTVIIHRVQGNRTKLKENYSALTGVDLRWMEKMCFWLLALVLFDIAVFPLLARFEVPVESVQFIFNLCSSFYVLWLARSAITQRIFLHGGEEKLSPSYEKSGLDENSAQSLAGVVVKMMEAEKLYLKPELVLADLAVASGVSNHILSEVLNKTIGQNFYDFVNGYRVKAAQSLLEETDRGVLDIAFAAGFNNKASFNQAFKKQVAMTPSQFRRSLVK